MTDDERDELATAYLDGECTAEERRQVESDPGLRARVAELAAVQTAVARPVAASPADRREEIIASALTEFGRIHGTDAPTPLTAARVARRTRPLWTRLAPLGAVAAVLVAVVGLAVVLRDAGSDDESGDDAATAAADLEPSEESATALAAEPPVETTEDVDADEQAGSARDAATTFSESAETTAAPEAEAAGGAESATTAAAGAAETTAAPETTAAADGGDPVLEHVCDPAVREIDRDLGELVEITDADGGSGRQLLVYGLVADPDARRSYEVDPPACADIVLVDRP